jgi:elongation factor G
MPKPAPLAHVRNIGVAAHVDAGKTTLTERILYYTGVSHKLGEVHDGTAHMDYLAEEQSHGITITSAVTKAPWRDHLLQIVDTPGHVDFTIEVERSMRVLDGCVLVLDGVRGVEPQTETVWRQGSHFNLPVLFFVNKVDRPGADFGHALESVRRRLGADPVAVTVPLPAEQTVVDLVNKRLLRFTGDQGREVETSPCPANVWQGMVEYREALLLAAAEADDELADSVLQGKEPPPERLWRALRKGTLAGSFFPCFGGSALRNLGVQPLLDGIVALLPAPLDRPPSHAMRPDGTVELVAMDAKGSLAALVFKVQMWDGRRHLFVRVYRGVLRAGDKVEFLTVDGKTIREQVARIFDPDAGHKARMDQAEAGQIVLLAGLRHATTGDTLCQPGHLVGLERIEARQPVLSLAIEPRASTDEDKLLEALDKLLQEDPTLRLEEDPETGQRLLRGMGELHLQILLERLEREFHLAVRSGRPAVAVRETVRTSGSGDVLYALPSKPDQKIPERAARVRARVLPLPRSTGTRVLMEPAILPEGSLLRPEQAEAVSAGIHQGLAAGPLQGVPLEDVQVSVEEVELFGQSSTPDSLSAAAAKAVVKAVAAADPAVLHPVMVVEVVVPDDNLGIVLGDLQSRQALIRDTRTEGAMVTIDCEVALERLLGYATDLRSQTQGRGQFSMQFDRFDLVS